MKTRTTAVLIVMCFGFALISGCQGENDKDTMTKQEAANLAKTDSMSDFCDWFGWYGDGICDVFCLYPDPDCEEEQDCYVGGCSSQVCSSEPGVITTCEWTGYYACYQHASCELLPSGTCAWTGDSRFVNCLYDEGACPYYSLPPPWWCDGGQLTDQDPDAVGCPRPPMCLRGEGASCGGEHDFQCDGGFFCVNGTCTSEQPCFIGGCNGQICSDEPGRASTCEWTDYYACYSNASCNLSEKGNCVWTGESDFIDCLFENGVCPYYQLPPAWWCEGGQLVDRDPDQLGCPRPPTCQRGQGATCGGEHDFRCDPGFACLNGICG